MFVQDAGVGPAVVFVPGLGATHTMYAPQVADMQADHRCLVVDLPGCGASGTLDGVAVEDTLDTQADALAAELRDRGIEQAHLAGISYGGVLVETMMLRHPELVRSAIICDSLCDTRPRSWSQRVQMWPAKLQPVMLQILPASMLAASVAPAYKNWPLAAADLKRTFLTARKADLVKQRRAVNAVQYADRLRDVHIPTLCLVGDHVPLAHVMMRYVAEVLPESTFEIIPDSFDPSSLCQPEAFTTAVREWVAAH